MFYHYFVLLLARQCGNAREGPEMCGKKCAGKNVRESAGRREDEHRKHGRRNVECVGHGVELRGVVGQTYTPRECDD